MPLPCFFAGAIEAKRSEGNNQMKFAEKAKAKLRRTVSRIKRSPLTVPLYYATEAWLFVLSLFAGRPRVSPEQVRAVEENVTFFYKSFNRHKCAKRLYRSIKKTFPNARVIIADDSREPLNIEGAEIIHLPFNSGLSKGLIAAVERIETPFAMRLDDDHMLCRRSKIEEQLDFLNRHPEVDLAAIQKTLNPKNGARAYEKFVFNAKLIIPAGTVIEGRKVVYKASNVFIARTDKLRLIGYDPNIRMLDHAEFFIRAAGVIVCAQSSDAGVFHWHNRFNRDYNVYRSDCAGDRKYIFEKHVKKRYPADRS